MVWNDCKSCEMDVLTTEMAYASVGGELELCRSCTELAWLLVSADLDRSLGLVTL